VVDHLLDGVDTILQRPSGPSVLSTLYFLTGLTHSSPIRKFIYAKNP
jgi:hypothetical protein